MGVTSRTSTLKPASAARNSLSRCVCGFSQSLCLSYRSFSVSVPRYLRPCLCVFVCLSVRLSMSVWMYVCVCVCAVWGGFEARSPCPCVSRSLFLYMCVSPCLCSHICAKVCGCVSVGSVVVSVYTFLYLSVHLASMPFPLQGLTPTLHLTPLNFLNPLSRIPIRQLSHLALSLNSPRHSSRFLYLSLFLSRALPLTIPLYRSLSKPLSRSLFPFALSTSTSLYTSLYL